MNRILQHTMAFLLAGMFLVSFTGMRLLVHHCMGCGTSELTFTSEPVSCCSSGNHDNQDAATNNDASEAQSCCAVPVTGQCGMSGDDSCCDVEVVYLKGEFQLTQQKAPEKIDVPVLDLPDNLLADILEPAIRQKDSFPQYAVDPPPRIVGKAFILFAHQIKIA